MENWGEAEGKLRNYRKISKGDGSLEFPSAPRLAGYNSTVITVGKTLNCQLDLSVLPDLLLPLTAHSKAFKNNSTIIVKANGEKMFKIGLL